MKTFTFHKHFFPSAASALVLLGFLVFSGCEKSESDCGTSPDATAVETGARPVTKNILILPFFVEGANQEWWANLTDNSSLYEDRQHHPILGPDGHAVTWGEWNGATGSAKINCTGQGTRLNANLEGLIPNGVYSLWLQKFQAPGFDTAYTNVSGFGAAGDGTDNVFTASANGTAKVHITSPAGPLSVFGSIGGCIPEEEYELHFVGIYHLDGKPGTTTPGTAGNYVEQFAFLIVNH